MEIEIGDILATGGYSSIRNCTINDEQNHVVKMIKTEDVHLLEATIMSSVIHPNIKSAVSVCVDEEYMYIFQTKEEYDLSVYKPDNIKSLLFGVVDGVAALHKLGICHGDLKSTNILYTDQPKITDFGMSSIKKSSKRSTNTYNYRPLEILTKSEKWGLPVDIWALGCVFWEIVTSSLMFPVQETIDGQPDQNKQKHINAILDYEAWVKGKTRKRDNSYVHPDFDIKIPDDLLDLIKFVMVLDQEYRPTIFDIAKHPYFKDFRLTEPKIRHNIHRNINEKELKRLTMMNGARIDPKILSLYESVALWYGKSEKETLANCTSLISHIHNETKLANGDLDLAVHLGMLLI